MGSLTSIYVLIYSTSPSIEKKKKKLFIESSLRSKAKRTTETVMKLDNLIYEHAVLFPYSAGLEVFP